MKRSALAEIAKQTIEILELGHYQATDGHVVDIRPLIRLCLDSTQLFQPAELERFRQQVLDQPTNQTTTIFEVRNETTLEGIARIVVDACEPIAVLNFASAKNAGGGFLNGSQAQEESLARSSALYASLMTKREFYDRHRASPSLLYSDAMIWSPHCPVFRNDEGHLLAAPYTVSMITSPAPNAGAIADNRPEEWPLIPATLHRRAEYVLALAAAQGCKQLVLGAWGCGVFRNDPAMVATAFATHLKHGPWNNRFDRVIFSVLDRSPNQETLAAFQKAFGENTHG